MNVNEEREFIIAAVTQAKVPTVHPNAANTIDIGRAVLAAYRAAPPALDAEGLPPLIWGDDLEAWLEVRDEAEIVAAIRAAQRHAYDAGQQSQAARIQHLTHERDLALAAARQSAPEGAPVGMVPIYQAFLGTEGWIDIEEREVAGYQSSYFKTRTLYAPTSASAQPQGENDE